MNQLTYATFLFSMIYSNTASNKYKQLKRIIDMNGFVPFNNDDKKILFKDSTGDVEKEKRFFEFLEG